MKVFSNIGSADKVNLKKPFQLRNEILEWLETIRVKDGQYGIYKMSATTEATLFSSCFAAFIRELYNDLTDLPTKQKQEWVDLINSWQDIDTGFFIDPRLRKKGNFSTQLTKEHDWGYVTWQATTFCISALKAMNRNVKYPLRFLMDWKNPTKIALWLKNLDWKSGTWSAGNVAMFLGICLITDYEMNKDPRTRNALQSFFDWHDRFQDPKTGFWGTNFGTPIHTGLFGAMHQYLLYYYTKHPLKNMEMIVDNTLLIQQPDGLFSAIGGGGACEDLDAVDTLVNMYKRLDYRRDDIQNTLWRVLASTLNSQNDDGGFPWAKRYRFGIKDWFNMGLSIARVKNLNYWYHSYRDMLLGQTLLWNRPIRPLGWVETPIPAEESYIFPTWFRSLNIALISQVIPENPFSQIKWRFLTAPGLGYFCAGE